MCSERCAFDKNLHLTKIQIKVENIKKNRYELSVSAAMLIIKISIHGQSIHLYLPSFSEYPQRHATRRQRSPGIPANLEGRIWRRDFPRRCASFSIHAYGVVCAPYPADSQSTVAVIGKFITRSPNMKYFLYCRKS